MTTTQEQPVKKKRGFAALSKEEHKKIAKLGGKAAHAKGTAHQWTSTEARIAGKKGGMVQARKFQNP